MTTDPSSGARQRTLRDDLLEDLRGGATRTPSPVATTPQPQLPFVPSPETPTVELRITPRSWSPVGWSSPPSGGGFVLTVGPIRLSLGRAHL